VLYFTPYPSDYSEIRQIIDIRFLPIPQQILPYCHTR